MIDKIVRHISLLFIAFSLSPAIRGRVDSFSLRAKVAAGRMRVNPHLFFPVKATVGSPD